MGCPSNCGYLKGQDRYSWFPQCPILSTVWRA